MRRELLGLVLALASAGGARAGTTATFKDWTVVCDNTRVCAAYGFSGEGAEHPTFLKIHRGAESGAPAVVTLSVYGEQAPPAAWKLSLDGKPAAGLGGLKPQRVQADGVSLRASLNPAQGAAVLAAIRNGAKLKIDPGGPEQAVSLAGGAAALRWMDEQQQRVDTVTALAAKGAKPASAVPLAPSVPLVRAAAPVAQAGLPAKWPKAVKALWAGCDEIPPAEANATVTRLGPGVLLWSQACRRLAYSVVYRLALSDEGGKAPKSLGLTASMGDPAKEEPLNVSFDAKTLTLQSVALGRGAGDCGEIDDWVWDGQAFQIISQVLMPACRGLAPPDWPTAFRSRQR